MENDITDIGKVAITPQKDYKENATYEWLDVVTYDGASYMCINEDGCTGIVPTNTEYWQLLADKGRFTEEDKEAFKQAVIEESKTTINEHTETKKTELNNYTTNLKTSLKNELDTYEEGKEEELDIHKTTLETEMTNTKDNLVQEIETAQNGFDENVTAQTTAFNNNATEKTNDFNTNVSTKKTEYDDNATSKLEEYNSNATAKVNEFNENAQSYATELTELAEQMPWNTTDISESIHVEDSAKYSRNKLDVFGNLKQDTREGYNLLDISVIKTQTSNGVTITNNGDGTLTFNGTATKSFGINTEITQKTIPAGNYTKYIIKDTNIGTGLTVSLGKTTSGSISGTVLQPKNGISSLELTEDLTYNQLRLYINSGAVFNNYVLKWMIVEGTYTSDTIPDYEPYGAMPSIDYPSMPTVATGVQKIRRCGKNILSRNFVSGFIPIAGEYPLENTQYPTSKYILLKLRKGKTYNLNCYVNGVLSNLTNGRLRCIDIETKKSVGNIASGSTKYYTSEKDYSSSIQPTGAITVKKDFILGVLFLIGTDTNICEIQIGENLTEYEKYNNEEIILDLGTTELCKITDSDGNVVAQDRAVYREVDGVKKWQWEKNVYKDILNGTRELKPITSYINSNLLGFVWPLTYAHKILGINIAVVSDKLEAKYVGDVNNKEDINSVRNVEGIALSPTVALQIAVTLKRTRLETEDLDGVKSFLNINNITCYYPLSEATYEDCTPEQSAVLDKLYKLQLEKGVNNIFVESENGVTTELQLEYMQDNNLIKEQEHKTLEDRITALEELLSTTQTSAMLLDNMQSDLESEV